MIYNQNNRIIKKVLSSRGKKQKENPVSYFTHLPDPRIDRCKEHILEDIIFITLAAVICGAETWNETEDYGKAKEEWLRQYLRLPTGIPSHDMFNRFFSALDPLAIEEAFISWIRAVSELTEGEAVSMDGKADSGSRDKGGKHAIHVVSARANANQLSPGQVKADEKSNEITAIPKLLDVPALKGCIVTIDAMGCQRDIAEKIVSREADYILAVKGNQAAWRKMRNERLVSRRPLRSGKKKILGMAAWKTVTASFIGIFHSWKILHCGKPCRQQ